MENQPGTYEFEEVSMRESIGHPSSWDIGCWRNVHVFGECCETPDIKHLLFSIYVIFEPTTKWQLQSWHWVGGGGGGKDGGGVRMGGGGKGGGGENVRPEYFFFK